MALIFYLIVEAYYGTPFSLFIKVFLENVISAFPLASFHYFHKNEFIET
jgi:hypothetical protein